MASDKGSDYGIKKKRLQEELAAGKFLPAYLIYGEEDYLRKTDKAEILKRFNVNPGDMNFTRYAGEGIRADEVIGIAVTLPFFADRRVILIENSGWFAAAKRRSKDAQQDGAGDASSEEDAAGTKEEAQKLIAYFKEPAPDTSIVFVEQDVNRTTGLFKTVEKCGFTLSCDPPPENMLRAWLRKKAGDMGKKLSSDAESKLLMLTAAGQIGDPRIDMNKLLSELDKAACYCGERGEITLSDVDAVCSDSLTDNVFRIVDRMAERDRAGAMKLYQEMMEAKPSPFMILSMIINRYNGILMVSELLDNHYQQKEIEAKTKLKPYTVTLCTKWKRFYTRKRLLEILAYCVEKEQAVKRGRMADVVALESVIAVCSAKDQ